MSTDPYICSATGHRPDLIGGYENPKRDAILQGLIRDVFQHPTVRKPDEMIVGMAQGWDMLVARACLELDIPYTAAIPFVGQEQYWNRPTKNEYNFLVSRAKNVQIVCKGGYKSWKFAVRDAWMVDHTTGYVLALWNGSETRGTWITIRQAQTAQKEILNLWSQFTAIYPLEAGNATAVGG